MNFYIIIPAYNEEACIGKMLDSLTEQILLPKRVVVVNDNSTDKTAEIVEQFTKKYQWISLVNNVSSQQHKPGQKIINAFYKGLDVLDDNYDVICKYDADLIFPENYLEQLSSHFAVDEKLGMCAGHCYILKNGAWQLESLTGKDHIRGALKAYKKQCFEAIGGLKLATGWDTIDELLAQYYGWSVLADTTLKVKHLKPTGFRYNNAANRQQGIAFYRMRYGLILTLLAFIKMSYRKKSFSFFIDCIKGYITAFKQKPEYLVTSDEGKFIRQLRWKNIRKKLF